MNEEAKSVDDEPRLASRQADVVVAAPDEVVGYARELCGTSPAQLDACCDSQTTKFCNVAPRESNTPPCLRWAKNFSYLLDDVDGVELYREYLTREGCEHSLLFWLACQGLKTMDSLKKNIETSISIIYKRYLIRQNILNLTKETHHAIHLRMQRKDFDQGIFDEAQLEAEDEMRSTTYRSFLQSDLYLQYVQEMHNRGFYSSEVQRRAVHINFDTNPCCF